MLAFCSAILKGFRIKKTTEYKKTAKEIDAKLKDIKKAKKAKEDELVKLNAEIE